MIQILSQYLLAEEDPGADTLLRQNQQLRAKIQSAEHQISRVIFQGCQTLSSNDKLSKILTAFGKSQAQLAEEKKELIEQGKQLNNLASYIEKYLLQEGTEPRALQAKIKHLRHLVEQSEQNQFSQEQTSRMKKWNEKLIQGFQKRLSDMVMVTNTRIRIRIDDIMCYRDLLSQQICRQFVRVLHKDILTYDVPTFSYILLVPDDRTEEGGIITIGRQSATFSCEKAQKYYDQILISIRQSEKLCLMLSQMFQQQYKPLHDSIVSQLASSKENMKAQIEYVLPYLSLEKRKHILEELCKVSQQECSIYDILVRLRIKGLDGDMIESNLRHLVQKLNGQNQDVLMDEVIVFLEICESDDRTLSIGFYVCSQLIIRLEGKVDYLHIERLLTLREEMRFRIHHPS